MSKYLKGAASNSGGDNTDADASGNYGEDGFHKSDEEDSNLPMYLLGGAVALAVGVGAYAFLARRGR